MSHRPLVPAVRALRGTVRLAATAVTVAAAVSAPSPAWTQPRELPRAIQELPQALPTRCHALPASVPRIERVKTPGPVIEAQCNASMVPGLPAAVRSGTPVPGGTLSFVDSWHSQCELWAGNRGTGRWKADTVCPIGQARIQEAGVWRCRGPDAVVERQLGSYSPRDECLAQMQLQVARVAQSPLVIGQEVIQTRARLTSTAEEAHTIVLIGRDISSATSVNASYRPIGAPLPPRPVRARLHEPTGPAGGASCAAPDCQGLEVLLPANTPDGSLTLELVPPAPARGTSVTLPVQGATRRFGAGLACGQPGSVPTVTQGDEFEISAERAPNGVSARAVAQAIRSPATVYQAPGSSVVAMCGQPAFPSSGGARQLTFTVRGLSGQGDVVVRWSVPAGSLNFDTQQTVALRPGRWVIQPDTNTADDAFPPGFTFAVTWRE